MAHTFDVRFSRSPSLAGFFTASANSFGWRGHGQLTIDSLGLEIGVKRGLASLFVRQRSCRIAADTIREVYRDGEALRIEFSSRVRPREVLPLWAQDRDAAAQIVELLPTTHTVEIEPAPGSRAAAAAPRRTWMFVAGAIALIAAAIGWVTLQDPALKLAQQQRPVELPPPGGPEPYVTQTSEPPAEGAAEAPAPLAPVNTPDSPLPSVATTPVEAAIGPAATPVGAASENIARRQTTEPQEPDPDIFVPTVPEIEIPTEQLVVSLRQGTLAYDTALEILKQFENVAAPLSDRYRAQRELFDAGNLAPDAYAKALDALEAQWAKLTGLVSDPRYSRDPALNGFLATLAAVTSYQRRFLSGYAGAIRSKDAAAALKALDDLKHADDMLIRARLYVR
jgi:hypothetical protein